MAMGTFPTILTATTLPTGRLLLGLDCGCSVTCDPVATAAANPQGLVGQGWAGRHGCESTGTAPALA